MSAISQNVGISDSGTPPDPSAMLDVSATNKGLLMPRMTSVQRDGIVNPAVGLQIFNLDSDCVEVFFGTGNWEPVKCGCKPTIPIASSATNVIVTDFDANWSASTGVDDYYLDVATDNNFTAFVAGFNNLNIGNVTTYNVTGLSCGTDYYYRVRAQNTCGLSGYSNVVPVTTNTSPAVPTASAATNINATDIDANWSASNGVVNYYLDVATDNSFTTFVSGFNNLNVGNVTTYNVTGLTCETDYHYRVRAENTCGLSNNSSTITVTTGSCWTCGSSLLTDSRDSKTYQTVQIGTQCWMKGNLNYTPASGNSWCYNNNSSNCTTYGRLYDWNAAMNGSSSSNSNPSGVQGICPTGWHLPSDAEWCQMENIVEANTDASCNKSGFRGTNTGKHLKATTWGGGDNTSGFTALSAGQRLGSFGYMGSDTYFWSTTENGGSKAWFRNLYSGNNGAFRDSGSKSTGFSVRCIKD